MPHGVLQTKMMWSATRGREGIDEIGDWQTRQREKRVVCEDPIAVFQELHVGAEVAGSALVGRGVDAPAADSK